MSDPTNEESVLPSTMRRDVEPTAAETGGDRQSVGDEDQPAEQSPDESTVIADEPENTAVEDEAVEEPASSGPLPPTESPAPEMPAPLAQPAPLNEDPPPYDRQAARHLREKRQAKRNVRY